jgi:hypothetical protein
MPVPQEIFNMHQAAHLCGQFPLQFPNPQGGAGARAQITRNFHVYLEIGMQSKHDALMRGYCNQIHVVSRREDGTQVKHAAGATAGTVLQAGGFYAQKAGIAANIIKTQMAARWQQVQVPGQSVFTPGHRVDAGVQSQIQTDRYRYEISYWYDGQDIYVLFHCYPAFK